MRPCGSTGVPARGQRCVRKGAAGWSSATFPGVADGVRIILLTFVYSKRGQAIGGRGVCFPGKLRAPVRRVSHQDLQNGAECRMATGVAVCGTHWHPFVFDRQGRNRKDDLPEAAEGAQPQAHGGTGPDGHCGHQRRGHDNTLLFPVTFCPARAWQLVRGQRQGGLPLPLRAREAGHYPQHGLAGHRRNKYGTGSLLGAYSCL